jgi:hypothetical protein
VPIEYAERRLILCEGNSDKAFFNALIEKRRLPRYQAVYPKIDGERGAGCSKFGSHLRTAIHGSESFKIVRRIVIVCDNDSNPQASFNNAVAQAVSAGFNQPTHRMQIVMTPGLPELAIITVPLGATENGSLESLLLEAALRKWPDVIDPIADYAAATNIMRWHSHKQAKAKLRCLIAAICEQRPDLDIGMMWLRREACQIPVTDSVFDGIAQVLTQLAAGVEDA